MERMYFFLKRESHRNFICLIFGLYFSVVSILAQNRLNQDIINDNFNHIKNKHPHINWESKDPMYLITITGGHENRIEAQAAAIISLQLNAALISGKLKSTIDIYTSVQEIIRSDLH